MVEGVKSSQITYLYLTAIYLEAHPQNKKLCEVMEVRSYIVESRKLHALESHRELANMLTCATREGNNVDKNGMGYAGLQTDGEHTDTREPTHRMVMKSTRVQMLRGDARAC